MQSEAKGVEFYPLMFVVYKEPLVLLKEKNGDTTPDLHGELSGMILLMFKRRIELSISRQMRDI